MSGRDLGEGGLDARQYLPLRTVKLMSRSGPSVWEPWVRF